MVWDGFIGGTYNMSSLPISAQRCINWYPESQGTTADSSYVLQPTPGYNEILDIDDSELPDGSFTRGIYTTSKGLGLTPDAQGSIIQIVGPKIYWIKTNDLGEWTWTAIGGDISNLTTTVSITDNGFTMVIADGTNMYTLDLETLEFKSIVLDVAEISDVTFLAGYTIGIGTSTVDDVPQNTFFRSNLYDNNTWDILNYASAEQSQDPILAVEATSASLYFFGSQSFEVWSQTGDSDAPFQRSYASSGSIGIYAPKSLVKFADALYMIGTSGGGSVGAYMIQGTQATKISLPSLEQEWAKNITIDCTSWANSHLGHDFIYFNFDALDKTYCYDVGEQVWSETASREPLTDTLHRWEPNFAAHRADLTIVADRFSTKLYELSGSYTTENGNNILRERITSHQSAEGKLVKFNAVRFNMETGNGITDESTYGKYSEAPTMMLQYSHDKGRTWSSELRQNFGRTGDYDATVEYRRLGVGRSLTLKFSISDAVQTSILAGYIYPTVQQNARK